MKITFRYFVLLGGSLALLAPIILLRREPNPVQMRVLRIEKNHSASARVDIASSDSYIEAVIAVTNASSRSYAYLAYGAFAFTRGHVSPNGLPPPVYRLLYHTPIGWSEPTNQFRCGTGIGEAALGPRTGFIFTAEIPMNQPCRVGVRYGTPNLLRPIMHRLPWSLRFRIDELRHWEMAMTDTIPAQSGIQ